MKFFGVVTLLKARRVFRLKLPEVSRETFYAINAKTPHTRDKLKIVSEPYDKSKTIYVETIHISCQSHAFRGNGYNYAGIILYQYHGQSEWRTANGTRCKSGYLVIQDTDSRDVKRWRSVTKGKVHGAVYRNAFGEDVDRLKVIGEGFSIMDEQFEINSGVFNHPEGSEYHDSEKCMSPVSEYCVKKVVKSWKDAGTNNLGCRNFAVEDCLKDYEERT